MEEENTIEKQPYLTFSLGKENFAVHVQHVKEIIELSDITRIPHAPEYIKGITNLRGIIVPVISLRNRFGLEPVENNKNTRIIIFELPSEQKEDDDIIGAVVDQTRDVIDVDESEIKDPPKISENKNAPYMKGIFKVEDTFFMTLHVDRLVSTEDINSFLNQDSELK